MTTSSSIPHPSSFRNKLIEVALPLEAIKKVTVWEKSPAWAPFHAAPVVGAAAPGGGP